MSRLFVYIWLIVKKKEMIYLLYTAVDYVFNIGTYLLYHDPYILENIQNMFIRLWVNWIKKSGNNVPTSVLI